MPVILPDALADEARPLLDRGERIGAVRLVRTRTGPGILPAVLAVDVLGDGSTTPGGPVPPVSG